MATEMSASPISGHATVREAARRMLTERSNTITVVEGGAVLGVVHERDLLQQPLGSIDGMRLADLLRRQSRYSQR